MRTSLLEGRKEERFGEPGNVAHHKRGLTSWKGGRGRSGLGASKRGTSQTKTHSLDGRKSEERVGELENACRPLQTSTHCMGHSRTAETAGVHLHATRH